MITSESNNIEEMIQEVIELAQSDELFAPESISLEPEGKSLTVRLPEKVKHFSLKSFVTIPAWGEDTDSEKECLLL